MGLMKATFLIYHGLPLPPCTPEACAALGLGDIQVKGLTFIKALSECGPGIRDVISFYGWGSYIFSNRLLWNY